MEESRQRSGEGDGDHAEERELYIPMCYASYKGDWIEALHLSTSFPNSFPNLLRRPINIGLETALHIGVTLGHVSFVIELLAKMEKEDLLQEDIRGKTAFSIAAESGNVVIAKILYQKNPDLPVTEGKSGFPIQLSSRFGHYKMTSYLYEITNFSGLDARQQGSILLSLLSSEMFDLATTMMKKEEQTLEEVLHVCGHEALLVLAAKPHAFQNQQKTTQNLLENLWRSLQAFDFWNHSLREAIFEGAKHGNIRFLVFFLSAYPAMLYEVDEKGHTIFHIAASLRHEAIFRQIYHIGAMKYDVVERLDSSRNCLLHLVAVLPPTQTLNLLAGAALQMQNELLWYEAVEKLVPRDYLQLANSGNETPHDVFVREHKTLRAEGEKLMKDTATSCMIVAALLITVVFAAAFTVPGGYSDKQESTGFPNFGSKGWFFVFIVADSVGLFTSIACLLIFLSIMTSRYKEIDFKTVLPLKLMTGLLALFISIICMMLSFLSTMTLIRQQPHHWSLILMYTFGVLTTISYVILHGRLWFETFRSTYHTTFLFHRGNKPFF